MTTVTANHQVVFEKFGKIAALAVAQIESLDRQIALDAARAAEPEGSDA